MSEEIESQRRLSVRRELDWDTVKRVMEILADEQPTYSVQRAPGGGASVFFSQRTYRILEEKLRGLKSEGTI